MNRSRPLYALWLVLTVIVGMATRKLPAYMPSFVAEYGGDTLWALMMFFIVGFLWKNKPSVWVAGLALAISFCVEISQLYQADWLNAIRSTTLGALVLGRGFLWTDFICYTVGVGMGCLGEILWANFRK